MDIIYDIIQKSAIFKATLSTFPTIDQGCRKFFPQGGGGLGGVCVWG